MKLFFVGIFVLVIVNSAFTLKCYKCEKKYCKKNKVTCTATENSCINFAGQNTFKKMCGIKPPTQADTCTDQSMFGEQGILCFCKNKDLCNSAQTRIMNRIVMFSAIIVAVWCKSLLEEVLYKL
uniref:UPAR/Ly6 domain-containing protein n=1 Tax=Strigamia maritima TaxID=126957 RepID=T1J6C3_STRMM